MSLSEQDPKDKGEKPGWDTPDGQRVEPNEDGVWPSVATGEGGGTIVAGGTGEKGSPPDQV